MVMNVVHKRLTTLSPLVPFILLPGGTNDHSLLVGTALVNVKDTHGWLLSKALLAGASCCCCPHSTIVAGMMRCLA